MTDQKRKPESLKIPYFMAGLKLFTNQMRSLSLCWKSNVFAIQTMIDIYFFVCIYIYTYIGTYIHIYIKYSVYAIKSIKP